MIMYVHRNTIDATDAKGPLAGVAKSAFWARDGIPIFFTLTDINGTDQGPWERPRRGMVGRSLRDDKTYVVAADGEVHQVESPWPTLQSYAAAVKNAADNELRVERMLKEFLTEEAALGLVEHALNYVTCDEETPDARYIFEEFKETQRGA